MKLVEKLKTADAYGPVLSKFQSAIIYKFWQIAKKSDSLYDYDTLYKVWMNRIKKIVKLEILQRAQ